LRAEKPLRENPERLFARRSNAFSSHEVNRIMSEALIYFDNAATTFP